MHRYPLCVLRYGIETLTKNSNSNHNTHTPKIQQQHKKETHNNNTRHGGTQIAHDTVQHKLKLIELANESAEEFSRYRTYTTQRRPPTHVETNSGIV